MGVVESEEVSEQAGHDTGKPRRRGRRWLMAAALILIGIPLLGLLATYVVTGRYGLTVLFERGAPVWSATGPDDPRLTPGMRLALGDNPPEATAGELIWDEVAPGLEVAELPALVDGVEVDRLLLSRVDPERYRFEVLGHAPGDRKLDDWMSSTGAAVVVNGGYFSVRGTPDTPSVIDSEPVGPDDYEATHGAFVAFDAEGSDDGERESDGAESASVIDLATQDWQEAFVGAHSAVVSYPMLIGADGLGRAAHADPDKLASRSFIGEDRDGNIIVGTTVDGFFSLARLSTFLIEAPLDLRTALNLDGGPVACQAVAAADYSRNFCGRWETDNRDGQVKLLGSVFDEDERYGLPLVLAARPVDG